MIVIQDIFESLLNDDTIVLSNIKHRSVIGIILVFHPPFASHASKHKIECVDQFRFGLPQSIR